MESTRRPPPTKDTLHVRQRSLKRASNVLQPSESQPLKIGSNLKRRLSKSLRRTLSGVRKIARSHSFNQPPTIHETPSTKRNRPRSLSALPAPVPEPSGPVSPPAIDVSVPLLFQEGVPMTKISNKRRKKVILRIEADLGHIVCLSKSHKIIPFESIKDIRCCADARFYREQFQLSREYEDRWLTLSYIIDGDYKILHLIADTEEVLQDFESTIRQLHGVVRPLMSGLGQPSLRQALWERHYWTSSDQEKDEKLVFEEVERLCKRLNIASNSEDLARIFKQADRQSRDYLDFDDFRFFVKLLKSRPEIDRLYKQIRSNHIGGFTFEAFSSFMRDSQQTNQSEEDLLDLFTVYATKSPDSPDLDNLVSHSAEDSGGVPTMSSDSFASFLLSADNPAFSDRHSNVWHDMSRPLPEYYISSSHNTYLVGNQLMGDSTIEGYIRALLHSCRSVEIDIYDGTTPLAEPMIFHGKTLTSKVSLREVCEAIRKYGFISSPYPIIISAEVHCGLAQQDLIADIMIQVFGEALIRAPLPERPQLEALPSPEDLKGKILLKTKNLFLLSRKLSAAEGPDIDASTSSPSDSDTIWERPAALKHARRESDSVREQAISILKRVRSGRRASTDYVPSTSPPNGKPSLVSRKSESDKPAMSFALAELLVYTVGVRCRGINKKEEYAPEHMFSLSEGSMNKMIKVAMMDLIKHNRTHLVRIYPKGMRLTSTNYEPHHYWAAGAQLVALNWQTSDLGFMINHAMFQRNGRCGYVLKPEALRIKSKAALLTRRRYVLDLTIISAQQLPRPKDSLGHELGAKFVINPYVEVSLHIPDWSYLPTPPSATNSPPHLNHASSSAFVRSFSYNTSVVKNNGFNPIWEEKFRIPFDTVGNMLDLIFLRFAVRQEDEEDLEPLAIYCISLGSLQAGYRHLPLHDSQLSQYLFSTLFIKSVLHDA